MQAQHCCGIVSTTNTLNHVLKGEKETMVDKSLSDPPLLDHRSLHSEKGDGPDSDDDALAEMLGLPCLGALDVEDDCFEGVSHSQEEVTSGIPALARSDVDDIIRDVGIFHDFETSGVCVLPPGLSLSASRMRRLADELRWGSDSPNFRCDRTYETVRVMKRGSATVEERRVLTRLENFVDRHPGWSDLCHGHIRQCVSSLLGEEYVLYKEKLNLKPPGGSGFAPHLDSPSLRVALGDNGPRTFITVMVAIDDMTIRNGCLRVVRGHWSEEKHCAVVIPEVDGNPDAGGRAGAILSKELDSLEFGDLECKGGTVAAFGGWTPHRSKSNSSPFPRRAVFLTYNPLREGDFHTRYYLKMKELRDKFRGEIGMLSEDEKADLQALKSVPGT